MIANDPLVPVRVSERALLALADPVISPPPPAHLEAISQSPCWAQMPDLFSLSRYSARHGDVCVL